MEQNITILKNLTILFVEDNLLMLEKTSSTLEIFFKKVYRAKNYNEAVEIYNRHKPNMIFSDIKLEEESGIDFAKFIRVNDYTTPIILLTSYSDQEFLLDAANVGIDGYIIKPLDLNTMIEAFLNGAKRLTNINSTITLSKNLTYHYYSKEIFYNSNPVELGEKENKLFDYFIENANKTISRKDIIYHIWPLEAISDSAFRNLLSRLRGKIGDNIIQTVKGKGWILKIDF